MLSGISLPGRIKRRRACASETLSFLPSRHSLTRDRTLGDVLERYFERIATAIGEDVADTQRHKKAFEAAAMWYRLRKRIAPSVMRNRMTKIANAARRLLEHLGVSIPPKHQTVRQPPFWKCLHQPMRKRRHCYRGDSTNWTLGRDLEAGDAARALAGLAQKGAEDVVQIGKLIVPKGHQGDVAENNWIAAMMSIYKQITGKDPGISVMAPGRPDRGKAAGPLIRFLAAAGKPLGIGYSPDFLRGRIKDVGPGGRRRQK